MSSSSNDVAVHVGDDCLHFKSNWTVAKVEKKIRERYSYTGGSLEDNGSIMDDDDKIAGFTSLRFVGFQSAQGCNLSL